MDGEYIKWHEGALQDPDYKEAPESEQDAIANWTQWKATASAPTDKDNPKPDASNRF